MRTPLLHHCAGLFYRLPEPIFQRLYPVWRAGSQLLQDFSRRLADRTMPCRIMEANGLRVLFIGAEAPAPYWQHILFDRIESPPPVVEQWPAAHLEARLGSARNQFDMVVAAMHRG